MKYIIFIFAFFSFMGSYGCINTTKKMINIIGYNKKYYPKKYIMPHRKMRRLFNLEKKPIPKWLYFDLWMSFVFVALFFVSTTILLLSRDKWLVVQVLGCIYMIVVSLFLVHVVICSIIYK